MPEYLAPGVYIEEISTGPRPIEGVSTSTAGFAGQTERGPLHPQLVTSWEEYYRWYGDYVDRATLSLQANTHTTKIYLPYAVRGFFANGGQRLFVARVVGAGAVAASADLGGNPAPNTITANGPGSWGNNLLVRIQKASLQKDNTPTAQWFRLSILYYRDGIPNPFVDPTDPTQLGNPARRDPDVSEDYDNLSTLPTDMNFGQSMINGGSQLVTVSQNGRPADVAFPALQLQHGTDVDPVADDYLDPNTDPIDKRKGLAGLGVIREISLISIPDEVVAPLDQALPTAMVQLCESLKDRFAILNVSHNDQEQTPVSQLRPFIDTTYGGYYYPWIRVLAPHTPEGNALVPPSGHLAGIYARVDDDRGVHKAPANEQVLDMILQDLPNNEKPLRFIVNKQNQDILNPKGVNCIRDFRSDGRGIRVWGARTMSSDPMWKYIPVRRLFIFVEQSIDRGTQWVVFEPNYESTWAAVRLSISSFLRTVWRNGGLAGATPDEAFFVKCDRTTMTQDDFDNGRLICLIGIAPVKPAEFVIFRISQKTLDTAQ